MTKRHLQASATALGLLVAGFVFLYFGVSFLAGILDLVDTRLDIRIISHFSFFMSLCVAGIVWFWYVEKEVETDAKSNNNNPKSRETST